MILTCNSCNKKFVVPDQAITTSGRTVQCGSCGNKWKQFPIKITKETSAPSGSKKIISKPNKIQKNTNKLKKTKKLTSRKSREINLYSPEYLAKKHGITLEQVSKKIPTPEKVSLGFYNSLLLFLIIIITLSRGLYFFQDFIVQKIPFTEFYINYFFESVKNLFEIWKSLISTY
jgi:predicted Zn finger-like uncharacterized protein